MFSEQFAFSPHSVVNFVGGGGKTALINRLMRESCRRGPVVSTTTTRIHPPAPEERCAVISCDNVPLLARMANAAVRGYSGRPLKLACTRYYLSPTLLGGVPPDFADLLERDRFSLLLNEADGAAGFPVKMPKDSEPVLMQNARYLVPVIGMDCIGRAAAPDVIFRYDVFLKQFPDMAGKPLTPQRAAAILMHPRGVCRDWKAGTTILPYINKLDDPEQDAAGEELSRAILRNGNFPVDRVVCGSLLRGKVDSVTAD